MNGKLWNMFYITLRARRVLTTHCRTETWHKISFTEYILSDKGGFIFLNLTFMEPCIVV